jgi:hypothetical protein
VDHEEISVRELDSHDLQGYTSRVVSGEQEDVGGSGWWLRSDDVDQLGA